MNKYLAQRFFYMILLLFLVSIVAFFIIELPPGDYLSSYIARLEGSGVDVTPEQILMLKHQYHLDVTPFARYFKWMGDMLHGNFGRSFMWERPVAELVAERLPLTIAISLSALIFTYAVAIPIGIYSATHQYSFGDYTFGVVGFIGLATPNFALALILMFVFYKFFGISIGGLFSPEFAFVGWSFAKVVDMLKHMPVPVIVIGTAGTAGLIRILRASLLDELRKNYVITARAKGVSETRLLFKYPVRVAINPIISTIGWTLPAIVSGETITALVLNIPTTGPLLFRALINQDMFLAGTIVMLLSTLTIIGTMLSDVALMLADPRIRFEDKEAGGVV